MQMAASYTERKYPVNLNFKTMSLSIHQSIAGLALCLAANASCATNDHKNNTIETSALKPVITTEQVQFDTDDPAIWIHPTDPAKSLVIGTDKDAQGSLYVFDLAGKIVNKVAGLKRPNNVDIAYGISLNGSPRDVAIVTERETNKLRIFSLPDLQPLDKGGIPVFEGEQERGPMGIAVYTNKSNHKTYAIVGRKSGPMDQYLWQYELNDDGSDKVKATLVRRFGKYSGKKEIEAIAVDNELGYVYYSDEQYGIHKYYADPEKGDAELALFGQTDFAEDLEGISIYKTGDSTGYILVSDQQANRFNVYKREAAQGQSQQHQLIAAIPFSTIESDGSEVTNIALNDKFPKGVFVAMTNGKTFQYYDWRDIQKRIEAQSSQPK